MKLHKLTGIIVGLLLLTVSVTAAQETVNLTFLNWSGADSEARGTALVEAFMAANPNVSIEIELRPGGAEGDNITKTRLATGEMADLFVYNSGSLLQALNPSQTLVDLTGEPFLANIVESYFPAVSQGDKIFGVPFEPAMGGGIFYNKAIYADLGLEIPTTWDEFVANNAIIKEAGITPVIGSFGDTWTAQLFVLADYYNLEQAVPGFADLYTTNQAKYSNTPAARVGFDYLQQGFELGWWQADAATTTFDQAVALLANGEGAHYPMLTFAVGNIAQNNPDAINSVGFFAQPGATAESNGATVWMPSSVYIPQTTQGAELEAALAFASFIASTDGLNAMSAAVPPSGPYMIKGYELPADAPAAILDLAGYIESGASFPALEFLSPVKGPNLEQLCVAVATGQMTAEQAAADYDFDVERQAQQLGLPGW